MKFQVVLLYAVVIGSCQSQFNGGHPQIAGTQEDGKHKVSVTVCPDNSPHDGCVTLDHLMSHKLIKSNMIFKFEPATFKLQPDSVTTFENVHNITLESAGAYNVSITCVGENSGFIFNNVSGLVIKDMVFTSCMTKMPLSPVEIASTLILNECSNVTLQSLTFKHGISCGVLAINIYGYLAIQYSVFTHMQGPGLRVISDYIYSSDLYWHHHSVYSQDPVFIEISTARFENYYEHVGLVSDCFAISIAIVQWLGPMLIHLEDVAITNNTHGSDKSGISISSLTEIHTIIKRVHYADNHVVGWMDTGAAALYYTSSSDDQSSLQIIN